MGVKVADTGLFQCNGCRFDVHFKVEELALRCPDLDNLIRDGLGRNFEYNVRRLVASMPFLPSSCYEKFYKMCYVLASEKAYFSAGVSDEELFEFLSCIQQRVAKE